MKLQGTLLILLISLAPLRAQEASEVYIHPLIEEYLAERDTISCMLVMEDQVRKMNVPVTKSKDKKAAQIYEILYTTAVNTQGSILDSLVRWNVSYKSFYIVNAIQARLDSARVNDLKDMDGLQSILPDFPLVKPPQASTSGEIRRGDTLINWALSHIGAETVWEMGITGKGVVVAGLDTGVESDHKFLKDSYRGYLAEGVVDHNYNWYDAIWSINAVRKQDPVDTPNNPCGLGSLEPCDDNGHGSFTMGLITGHFGSQYTGVAPGATWIGSRVMDQGDGRLSTYLSGLEWCMAPTNKEGKSPRTDLAPDIINNSWACPQKEGCISDNYWMLDSAASRLNQAGILVIASAGNNGREGCSSLKNPLAIFPSVFTVGATDQNDSVTSFSSRGPIKSYSLTKPDVVAPGQDITSISANGAFQKSSGTSISAPIVAGVAALILEANPQLRGRPDVIREILLQSAKPIFNNPCGEKQHPNPVYGYGRIDAHDAVEQAVQYEPTAVSEILEDHLFNVYPNPFNRYLRISSNTEGHFQVKIYNIQGQLVEKVFWGDQGSLELYLPYLQPGLYFARIISEQGVFLHKIVKY